MADSLKSGQLVALQTLWSQYARHSLDIPHAHDREARLQWAAQNIGREIASFKDLTVAEAASLIDTLQHALGREPVNRPGRDRARAAGTEGRRDHRSNEVTLAGAADLARIEDAIARLGWSQERFAAWLDSPRSPLRRQASKQIRTVADANRVWWALKPMLKKAGKWTPAKGSK